MTTDPTPALMKEIDAAFNSRDVDRFQVIGDMRWDHLDCFVTGNRAVTVWMVTGTGADGETLNVLGGVDVEAVVTRFLY